MDEIVNRVEASGLITIDLEEHYHGGRRILLDIKDQLFQGLILKEKDFRQYLKDHDWSAYAGMNVAITCTADAVIPTWAYMLLSSKLQPYAHKVVFGDLATLELILFHDAINKIEPSEFMDAKVVVKGCSKYPVPVSAYVELTNRLLPFVSSLMFGEPCSTVPVYKKSKAKT